MRRTNGQFSIVRFGIYAFLIFSALFFLVPIYIMVATSLKTMEEIRAGNSLTPPAALDFTAWRVAWSEACSGLNCRGVSASFWNSIKITLPAVVLACIIGAFTGYTLSFWRFRGMGVVFGILVLVIFVPYQVFIFPLIQLSSTFGLYGTLQGVVIIHVIFALPITTLMFRNYYASLPIELFKAARVDGAGYFRIFFQIVLPLSPPIIVVVVIWQATAIWNDYLFGMVFAGRANQPMTVALNSIIHSQMGVREYNIEMAATLITTLMPLAIYFLSGRWFVQGITSGAVKG